MKTTEAALLFTYGLLTAFCPSYMRAQQVPLPTNVLDGSGGTAVLSSQSANFATHAPRVTCQGNRLTITAENSTLGSIMSAVRACIGVEIDMPDAAAEELSYVQLGPGPTREVLDSLLSSTQFNYAIQSSTTEPEKIASILLMARVKAGDDSQDAGKPVSAEYTMTPARQTWLASVRAIRAGVPTESERPRMVGAEPTVPVSRSDVRSAPTGPDAAVADASTSDATPASNDTRATARVPEADVQQAAVSADAVSAAAPAPPASELQNKIGEMQQLFEQRKKMTANLGITPTQN